MDKGKRFYLRARWAYALAGFVMGLGAPLGWLVGRALFSQPDWIAIELSQYGILYGYMTVGTVTVFTLFGYVIGRRGDSVINESEEMRDALGKVSTMAMTDELTGLHNARFLHHQIALEFESSQRYATPLVCMMIDIDNFKKINDEYGHPVGDIVLSMLAQIILGCVRKVDIVGRLGGEEFLILMPHTNSDTAFAVAERIRQAVQRWPFKANEHLIPLTISIGVASYPAVGVLDKSSLLKAADDALYKAKRSGKNKTVISSGQPSSKGGS